MLEPQVKSEPTTLPLGIAWGGLQMIAKERTNDKLSPWQQPQMISLQKFHSGIPERVTDLEQITQSTLEM